MKLTNLEENNRMLLISVILFFILSIVEIAMFIVALGMNGEHREVV